MAPIDPIKPRFTSSDPYKVQRKKRPTRDSRAEEQADKKDEANDRGRGKHIDDLA